MFADASGLAISLISLHVSRLKAKVSKQKVCRDQMRTNLVFASCPPPNSLYFDVNRIATASATTESKSWEHSAPYSPCKFSSFDGRIITTCLPHLSLSLSFSPTLSLVLSLSFSPSLHIYWYLLFIHMYT